MKEDEDTHTARFAITRTHAHTHTRTHTHTHTHTPRFLAPHPTTLPLYSPRTRFVRRRHRHVVRERGPPGARQRAGRSARVGGDAGGDVAARVVGEPGPHGPGRRGVQLEVPLRVVGGVVHGCDEHLQNVTLEGFEVGRVVWIKALTSGKWIAPTPLSFPPSHPWAHTTSQAHTKTGQGELHERGQQEHTTLSTTHHWHRHH